MAKINETAPKKRDLKLPECTGCSQCGDAWEDHLYALGHNGKYYCRVCFQKIAVNWPKRSVEVALPMDRIRYWMGEVKKFEVECRKTGKNRTAMYPHIPVEHRDLNQAVECAAVEMLGGAPNLEVHVGNDGKKDGVCALGSYDVKGTVVRSNWSGPQGFNGYPPDGRVAADLIVCVLCMSDMGKAAIVGYNKREATMRRIAGFAMPAYAREDLLPAQDLLRGER
jgi:hypothetical protein